MNRNTSPVLITACLIVSCVTSFAASLQPASRPAGNSASAAGASSLPLFSEDERYVVFVSHANNLTTNDNKAPWLDVFLRDITTSNTVLVSVSQSGAGGGDADAGFATISSNGQHVAFVSRASNFVPGDTNGADDVFVRNIAAGTTVLVSKTLTGASPSDPNPTLNSPLSGNPLISPDGRYVLFESRATNLVDAAPGPGSINIYRRDLFSETTTLVSAGDNGLPIAGKVELLTASRDAQFVAFLSTNSIGLAARQGTNEVYLRNLLSGETSCASVGVNALTNLGAYRCTSARMNGTSVWFVAVGAVSGGLFRFDHPTGALSLLASCGSGDSAVLSVSDDARYILFVDAAAGARRYDSVTGTVLDLAGSGCACPGVALPSPDCSLWPQMSANGTHALFYAKVDCNKASLVCRDLSENTTNVLFTGTDFYEPAALSQSGMLIAFATAVPTLVTNDLNGETDVFLYRSATAKNELISTSHPDRSSSTSPALVHYSRNSISTDGRFLAFARLDDHSVFRDTNQCWDAFLADLQSGMARSVSLDTNLHTSETGGPPLYRDNTNSVTRVILSGDGTKIAGGVYVLFHNHRAVRIHETGAIQHLAVTAEEMSLSENGDLLVIQSRSAPFPFTSANNEFQIYAHRGSNLFLVSGSTAVQTGRGGSTQPVLSRDARWVTFATTAADLLPGGSGTYSKSQVLAADLGTDTSASNYLVNPPKRLVSHDATGQPLAVGGTNAVISGNSRYVVFAAVDRSAVYRHDLLASNTINQTVCTGCGNPSVSADGNVIAYDRLRTGTTGTYDVYVVDLVTGAETLISANVNGSAADGSSFRPQVSANGRFVVFESKAADLVANDRNNATDVFLRDRFLGATMLLSATPAGHSGDKAALHPVLSADGTTVAFQSFATDLLPGDYNSTRDIFVAKISSGDSDADGLDDDWEAAYFGNLSRTGYGDFDGDGISDAQEFAAGTDPTNHHSVFRVITIAQLGSTERQVKWIGNSALAYRVEYKDDLNELAWSPLNGAVTWSGATATMVDGSAATNRFYRVLRMP